MTIHRFFITDLKWQGNKLTLPKEQADQISKVLRLHSGDKIIILDNSLAEYHLRLDIVSKNEVSGTLVNKTENANESDIKIVLYQSILPREKFELVLQKATEIGVSEFVPIKSERTIFNTDYAEGKLDRWERIIKEASEQSERGVLPLLNSPMKFETAIIKASENGKVLIAWENEMNNQIPISQYSDSSFHLFVGPEGGFSEKEIEFAKSKGAETISLGKTILRSETAGIIFPAMILMK